VVDIQGVIILDAGGRIRVVSPGAEDLLGWRAADVTGFACSLILDCRDAEGKSLCASCGGRQALERHEVTPSVVMAMADSGGGRQQMRTSFWYLPPSGVIWEERVMAVFHSEGEAP
jgi:PAS domain-containing protein